MGIERIEQIVAELVLPSGRFASFRRLRGGDLIGIPQGLDPQTFMFHLLSRAVLVDGEELTQEQFEEMDLQDVLVVQAQLHHMICGPMKAGV